MNVLTRYCGRYVVEDLLLGRMSVSNARGFNDPFELHFNAKESISHAEAKRRARFVADQPGAKNYWNAISKDLPRARRRKLQQAIRPAQIEALKVADVLATARLREQVFEFFDHTGKLLCCTDPDVSHGAETAMWSYYANDHQGVRVHLNSGFFGPVAPKAVEYLPSPRAYDSRETKTPHDLLDFIEKIIWTKSEAWKHEQEVRLLFPVDEVYQDKDTTGTVRWFRKVAPADLKRVDFGIRFDKAEELGSCLLDHFPDVELFQAIKPAGSYFCEYVRIS